MKHIFFFEPGIKIKKYITDKYQLIKLDDIKKYKYLEWIYFSSQLPGNYKKDLYKIKTKWSNWIIYEKPNIFNKNDLYTIMINGINENNGKNYLIDQILIKSNKSIDNFMKKGKLYIVKPIPGSGGVGVKVFSEKDKLKEYIKTFKVTNEKKKKLLKITENSKLKWILQEYIDQPLILDSKKFHLRVLFLNLMKNEKKLFYLYDKFFVYTASKKYTNKILNKNIHNTLIGTNAELKRAMIEYDKLDQNRRSNIREQIINICKNIKQYMDYSCYDQSKNCYQFAGLDFIVTNDYKVKLIEINERPGTKGPSSFPSFWKGILNLTLSGKSKTKDYIKL